jgi:hypothetical protein
MSAVAHLPVEAERRAARDIQARRAPRTGTRGRIPFRGECLYCLLTLLAGPPPAEHRSQAAVELEHHSRPEVHPQPHDKNTRNSISLARIIDILRVLDGAAVLVNIRRESRSSGGVTPTPSIMSSEEDLAGAGLSDLEDDLDDHDFATEQLYQQQVKEVCTALSLFFGAYCSFSVCKYCHQNLSIEWSLD